MSLTPLDIENTRFKGALGGYSRAEVDLFMIRIARALEDQLEQAQVLKQRIAALEEEVVRHRESEELLKNSVMLAQKTCDDLVAAARKKAELIHDKALAEGETIKREFAELRSQREQFEYAFHGLLTGFINRLEQGNPSLVSGADHRAIEAPPPASDSVSEAVTRVTRMESERESEHDIKWASPELQPSAPSAARPAYAGTSPSDRDGDIDDFSSAVSGAGVSEASWPETSSEVKHHAPDAQDEMEGPRDPEDSDMESGGGHRLESEEGGNGRGYDKLFESGQDDKAKEL